MRSCKTANNRPDYLCDALGLFGIRWIPDRRFIENFPHKDSKSHEDTLVTIGAPRLVIYIRCSWINLVKANLLFVSG